MEGALLAVPGWGFGWFPGPRSLKTRAQYKSNNHLTGGSARPRGQPQYIWLKMTPTLH